MQLGNGKLEIKSDKKQSNIALASNEKNLNFSVNKNHHIQGLNQSKYGFWLSVGAAIGGFIIIVISLFLDKNMIGIISATIIEVVSVLFFSISNKTNDRINKLLDKSRIDSNILKSLELSKSISDIKIRDELKVKLSLYLVGINEEKICKHSFEICKYKQNNKYNSNYKTNVNNETKFPNEQSLPNKEINTY